MNRPNNWRKSITDPSVGERRGETREGWWGTRGGINTTTYFEKRTQI